jgi:uncharacterized delta-60 repeat protein
MATAPDGDLVVAGEASTPDADPFGPPYPTRQITVGRYDADGAPDTTFGDAGFAMLAEANPTALGALLVTPEGAILTGGRGGPKPSGLVAWHTGAGALDDTLLAPDASASLIDGLARQPDGSVVVDFTVRHDPWNVEHMLRRLTPAGAWDPGFGAEGSVRLGHGVIGLTSDADGRLLALRSSASAGALSVVRFLRSGRRDTSFGTDGLASLPVPGGVAPSALALAPEGGVVAVGGTNDGIALARFTSSGAADTTFGTGGLVTRAPAVDTWSTNTLAVGSDGEVVVAGSAFMGHEQKMAALRLTRSGAVDEAFGDGGLAAFGFPATPPYGAHATANAVLIQPSGRIVLAGTSAGERGGVFTLVGLEGNVEPSAELLDSPPVDGALLVRIGWPFERTGEAVIRVLDARDRVVAIRRLSLRPFMDRTVKVWLTKVGERVMSRLHDPLRLAVEWPE